MDENDFPGSGHSLCPEDEPRENGQLEDAMATGNDKTKPGDVFARQYMSLAEEAIDRRYCPGYAKSHPELVSQLLAGCAGDAYADKRELARNVAELKNSLAIDEISDELIKLRIVVDELSNSVGRHQEQLAGLKKGISV